MREFGSQGTEVTEKGEYFLRPWNFPPACPHRVLFEGGSRDSRVEFGEYQRLAYMATIGSSG
ncbi:MAG: hypothetical protein ACJA16_003307 [Akkermansiaceae bacterium]|jgi:hypothetical protein